MQRLDGFAGSLRWIHEWEGHEGKPYWPGGRSGVTLDPGLDLGWAPIELIELYFEHLPAASLVEKAIGLRGDDASRWLTANQAKADQVGVSLEQAWALFPFLLESFWAGLDELGPKQWPSHVQTALLSHAFNRDVKAVKDLRTWIEQRDWIGLAWELLEVQQSHKLRGVRRRRRAEGLLVLKETIQPWEGLMAPRRWLEGSREAAVFCQLTQAEMCHRLFEASSRDEWEETTSVESVAERLDELRQQFLELRRESGESAEGR